MGLTRYMFTFGFSFVVISGLGLGSFVSEVGGFSFPALAQALPPDYFPLRQHDWWKYRSTTGTGQTSEFQVSVVGPEPQPNGAVWIKVETTSQGTSFNDWYLKPPGLVIWQQQFFPSNNQSVTFTPARTSLKNPPKPGDTWSWQGSGMMGVDISESFKVSGAEKITVPAGTFETIKVEGEIVQGGTASRRTIWYANQVGPVKVTIENPVFQSTAELLDYSFKK